MSFDLSAILRQAGSGQWALPHFNVSNLEQLRGVVFAATKLRSPLLIGTSIGERNFIGIKQVVALVKSLKEELNIPIFLNADHTTGVAAAKVAIDAGFDSIHIDLSKKLFAENLAGTKEVVAYAKRVNPSIQVEGELGYLVTESSKVYRKKVKVDPSTFTKPEEAERFVEETGVHRLAPAVGNLHGIAANRPKLDFILIKKLRSILPSRVALVLHGGSGNSPAVFRKCLDLGISNIHISTELRLAYARALKKSLQKNPDELAPYKLMAPVVEAVQKKAEEFIKIFRANDRC